MDFFQHLNNLYQYPMEFNMHTYDRYPGVVITTQNIFGMKFKLCYLLCFITYLILATLLKYTDSISIDYSINRPIDFVFWTNAPYLDANNLVYPFCKLWSQSIPKMKWMHMTKNDARQSHYLIYKLACIFQKTHGLSDVNLKEPQ